MAAPSTGQGKTTIATGLMAALRARGYDVSGHKIGPDYIDPGYHALATGRPGRNLDPHLVGEQRIAPLLLHGARNADLAVIEGVMGLFDGRLGSDGFASTAHVAALTHSPVVLVVDVARMSRTTGAIVAGLAAYEENVNVAGVILNRAGSDRNVAEIRRSLERTGLPVLGVLPREDRIAAPSRHLGLVPAAERGESARTVALLGAQIADHLDLDALVDLARSAPDLDTAPWSPTEEVHSSSDERPVVALARGRAFTFAYPETVELLQAAGCEVVVFDPLRDPHLPEGTRGIHLGGGFPEVHVAELAANRSLLDDLRQAIGAGVPTVAECAGLLLLAQALDAHSMAGGVDATAEMTERLTLRYPVATAPGDNLLSRAGESVTGHEFHRTSTLPAAGPQPAWIIDGTPSGFAGPRLHASYLHVHWAGHPQLAQRFADAVHAATPHRPAAPTATPVAPLLHHGDVEATPGLLDFAVNVHPGDRPEWLDRALHQAIEDAASYPDARQAAAALAAHHCRVADEVLPTAGAAEAFTLLAGVRRWQRPVVVHPQFTEPHAALERAGHTVTVVPCRREDDFALDPAAVPEDADLVVLGNPVNPTGTLHPAATIRALLRPHRVVVVDEAFMDAVPGEPESLVAEAGERLVVVRSLTKQWSMPGIRAGYVVAGPDLIAELAAAQTPWSVSTPASAAMIACATEVARLESDRRAQLMAQWRADLEHGLGSRGIEYVPSSAPFVLARVGRGVHAALRELGVAVRRADTFPGLDDSWVRIAARPPETTARLLDALDRIPLTHTQGTR